MAQTGFAFVIMVMLVMSVVSLVVAGVSFAGKGWNDWLDERWGRGSVKDDWLLDRISGEGPPEPLAVSSRRRSS